MVEVRQKDLADEMGISTATVSRIATSLYRERSLLTDTDAIKILAVQELQSAGFSTPVACELLIEADSEIRYLIGNPERRAWLVFAEHGERSFRIAALNERHLAALVDAVGMSVTFPLHHAVAAAQARLDRVKTRRAAA